MNRKPVSVKIQSQKGSEDAYFVERDQKLLRELREREALEENKQWSK